MSKGVTETNNGDILSLHAGYEDDGVYTDAFIARPAHGTGYPGMVLLSGMGGMTWVQREITRLYARAGFVALSPDFMGESLDGHAERLHAKNALDVDLAVNRIVAGAAFLRSLPWVGESGRVGIMGFCLGGGLAILGAARSDAFQAAVIYHHSLFPDAAELDGLNCRLQYHNGTDDHSTPREEVEAFTQALDQRGKDYELHWYEGMPHSFAQIAPDDDVAPERRKATDLSYQRSFEFLRRELSDASAKAPAG
jgi:carboxymethylenebutenolidase